MKKTMMILLAVMLLGVGAQGDLVTYTAQFDDSYDGYFNINEVLSVPQFSGALSDLVSVSIDFDIYADGTLGYENGQTSSAGSRTVRTYFTIGDDTYSTYGDLSLSLGATTLTEVDWDVQEIYTFNVTTFDGVIDFAGTSGWSMVYLGEADNGSQYYDSGLAAFVGSGTVDFDLVGYAFSAVSFPSGTTMFRTTGGGNVTVTYEYVPEPATMVLLGLGSLAIMRVRKQA